MLITIKPFGVYYTAEAIKLLCRKDERLAMIAEETAEKMGQKPLEEMEITLIEGSFAKLPRMFNMPNQLTFKEDVVCICENTKAFSAVEATPESAKKLDTILRQLLGEKFSSENKAYHLPIAT